MAKTSQRVSSACHSVCCLAVLDQVVVDRLEQGQEPLQAVGQRALRQVQAVRAQVRQQAVGRAVEQELVQQHGDPDRDAQDALGDHLGRRRCGDDAGVSATGAGGAVAAAAVDPAMGADLDLQDRGVVGAGEGGEGLSAAGAPLLFGGQFEDLFDGGQVGVVAAFGSRLPALLAAGAWRSGRAGGALGRWSWSRPCVRRVAARGGGVGPGVRRSLP